MQRGVQLGSQELLMRGARQYLTLLTKLRCPCTHDRAEDCYLDFGPFGLPAAVVVTMRPVGPAAGARAAAPGTARQEAKRAPLARAWAQVGKRRLLAGNLGARAVSPGAITVGALEREA